MLPATVRTDPNQERERALAGALARLAFGAAPSGVLDNHSVGPRHLAFLPPEVLELDLDDPAQRQFGDYELVEKLGQGGMGVVYRARQRSLDREVALKLLSAGPWASKDFIERFRREAQSAARMQHPNIVPVFEIGSHEELNFFSMRLVHGLSLAHEIAATGPLAPRRAAQLMRTIAEALDYAHRLGVLHLDLKPGNVLMDERGEPQVADFGLARRLDETLAATDDEEVSGTPSYMAPEQAVANARKLSPATDIYGLGAILYELLTGVPPFLGPTAQATLQRVVSEALEPPRRIKRDIPRDLDAICLKCLEKDPARRYASARELAADLGRFLDGRPVSVRPLNPAQHFGRWVIRHPELAALGALLLVSLLAGLGATALQWQRAEANAAASNERLWAGRREVAIRLEQAGSGFEAAARLSLNIAERERLEGSGAARVERSHLGVLLGQGLKLIDSMLIADANPLAVEVSPDGRLLAVGLNDSTVRWFDTRTLTEQGRVDLTDQPTSEGFLKLPALLRFVDDERLRVTLEWYRFFASPQEGDSFLIDLRAGRLVEPPPAFDDLSDATFSADGAYALLRNTKAQQQLWQVAPWKPLSGLMERDTAARAQPWYLVRGARFAAKNLTQSQQFELADPRDLRRKVSLQMPAYSGFSAWTESHNGAWLALGDTESRVFLLDLSTQVVRVLPTPKGEDITWLAFSEDDAWLAACSLDGSVYAFDVTGGTPLASGVMQAGFEPRRVAISRWQRLVIAAGLGQTSLWRLPEPGPQSRPPGRLGTSPAPDAMAGDFSVGWSLSAGLLATANVGGEVRLWRLPVAPMMQARSARLPGGVLEFDGKRIIDTAGDQIRIVSPRGNALTPWLSLPGVPGYAELARGGETLVVTVANELRAYDANTLRPRFAPVPLAATPQNLSISGDGSAVLLSFGHAGAHGFEEHVEVRELGNGAMRAGPVTVPGPLRQLEFSPDGRHVLATGPPSAATEVYDSASLERLGRFPHDRGAPVAWAAFAREPGALALAQRAGDARLRPDALVEWSWSAGELARHELPMLKPVAVAASPGGMFVVGSSYNQFDPGGPRAQRLEHTARDQVSAAFSVSPDGRLLAQAFRHGVQLYDARTLDPVGPPLYGEISRQDGIQRLAFSPDSRLLLARTARCHWLVWHVGPIDLSADEIGELLGPMRPGAAGTAPLRVPTPAERQRLRSADTGNWHPPDARPEVPAARVVAGTPIPARRPGTDPLLLDMTRVYNIAPGANLNEKNNVLTSPAFLASGLQRLDGVDYDIRGSVQMAYPEGGPRIYSTAVRGIEVPPVPVAAFHVLLFAGHRSTEPEEREYARVRLHYADGTQAALPLRTRVEVPGFTEKDGPVPFAWAFGEHLRMSGAPELIMMSNPRLPNPHPDRIVRTLDLESGEGTWNAAVFLAITAEAVNQNVRGTDRPTTDRDALSPAGGTR